MTNSIRDYRAASYLPPVPVCLLLALASLALLSDTAGDTKPPADASHESGSVSTPSSPELSQAELRIRTWLRLAERQRSAGQPDSALVTLRRAEGLHDAARIPLALRAEIQRQVALSLDAAARHDEAVEIWWQLLSISPRHDEIARGLAASLYASGRPEEARRVYREILHTDFGMDQAGLEKSREPGVTRPAS
ncbi:MAG: bacterial transcriptional activator domain-containing protein [Thermoanaerobaculia bacterium]|nr:bacterial transcriptional activator domain-containing protein [Thermoanaerobaculia bacterium]